MDNEKLYNIIMLSEDKKLNGEKLRKISMKCCDLIEKINDDSYSALGNARRCILMPVAIVTGMRGVYQEFLDIKRREKIISKVLDVESKLVTGDLTTFISSDTRFPYFVDNLQYDASISLDRMQALKLVWGDIDLRKLHDFSYVKSLQTVMGDVYISTAENIDELKHLQVVTGDIYMEQLDNISFFGDSLYVGGMIYTKQGPYKQDNLFHVKNNIKK